MKCKLNIEQALSLFELYDEEKYHNALSVVAYLMIGNKDKDVTKPFLIHGDMTKEQFKMFFKLEHEKTKLKFHHLLKISPSTYVELLKANLLAYKIILKIYK